MQAHAEILTKVLPVLQLFNHFLVENIANDTYLRANMAFNLLSVPPFQRLKLFIPSNPVAP